MDLKTIHLTSFRSIVDVTLNVTHRCMAFVGLNETGKTNLLTGIRSLDGDYSFNAKDKCRITEEMPKIEFNFDLNQDDNKKIISALENWLLENSQIIYAECFRNVPTIVTTAIKTLGLDEGGQKIKTVSFNMNLSPKKNLLIIKRESKDSSDPITINGIETTLNKAKVILKEHLPSGFEDKYQEYHNYYLRSLAWSDLISAFNSLTPSVVFWKYDEKYLIPSEISYDDFLEGNDPYSVCTPLYNIFLLCEPLGIANENELGELISQWKENSGKRKTDMEAINSSLNQHIKSIWKEYEHEFDIGLETDKITIHITDPKSPSKGFYEMEQRSQGFLSFISFLLTISAETKYKGLDNYILILDEPETHLHPSGVRFMRDELLKIANEHGNRVFFATHSIFMIDRKELQRHVIVKKQNECTKIEPASENNVMQEAVLYLEGFGTRTDEFSIGLRNIVFEGGLDKDLFEFINDKCVPKSESKFKGYAPRIGGGTNNIEKFFKSTMPTTGSNWILILDKDSPGRTLEQYLKNRHGSDYSKYYSIKFYGTKNGIELEDLLPLKLVQESFVQAIATIKDGSLEAVKLTSDPDYPIGSQIETFKNRNSLNKIESELFEEKYKEHLESLVASQLQNILRKKTIKEKMREFKRIFPSYFGFWHSL